MKKRVISAVVLLSVSFLCVLLSPVTRVLFFAVAGMLCAYELSRNFEKLDARCTLWVMVLYLCVHTVLVFTNAGLFAYCACFLACLYLALFSGILHRNVGGKGALYTLAGLTYPCLLFAVIMVICVSDAWLETLIIACFSTWLCDTFALFGGMRFGKHKVAPLVSPNKTVEGCLCGALSSVLVGVLVYYLFPDVISVSLPLCMLIALLGSTMGQIGDLAESLMKRMIGVKDFSNLIPGHGGMFDRADSLLFSIPTVYFCLRLAAMI